MYLLDDEAMLEHAANVLEEDECANLRNMYQEALAEAPGEANPRCLKSDLGDGITARDYGQPMPYPEIPHTERLHTHKKIGVSKVLEGKVTEYSFSPMSHEGNTKKGLWMPNSWEEPVIAVLGVGKLLCIPSTNRYWHRVETSPDAITLMIERRQTEVSYGLGDDGGIMVFPSFVSQRAAAARRHQESQGGRT